MCVVSQWESGNAQSAWLHVEHAILLGKVTKMSVQEVVKQPWSLRQIGGKVYNACKCAGEENMVSNEEDHDANIVYPNGKAPYVSSVTKQEVPMPCLTQHCMPVQSTI